jgi:lipoprotein-anchoring transpeptidase ErfK/SrfK
MTNRFATAYADQATRRSGLFAVTLAATAVLLALTAPQPADAAAKPATHPAAAKPTEEAAPRDAGEPIMAIVSIKSQHVTIYDADGWILRAPVSTGMTGRETPAGVFSVVEKDKDHHSNLYDDASMPNMQRITWSGIAMHGGPLPGHAASHGCVRLPYGFAENLFDKTRIGMRVIISPNDAEPVEFTDPALLVPNAAAIKAAPERAEKLAREAAEVAKTAEQAKSAAVAATRATVPLAASQRKLEWLKSRTDVELAYADKALAAATASAAKAEDLKQKATAKVADLAAQLDTAKADLKAKLDAAAAARDTAAAQDSSDQDTSAAQDAAAARNAAAAAREAASFAASVHKQEMLKARADTELAYADKVLAAAKANQSKAEDFKQKASAKAADMAAQLDAAKADAKAKLDAAAAAQSAAKAAEAKMADAVKAAHDAKLALEPVSIFISRSTQKIYVRRGFDSVLEVPVTIRDPDKPLGTHVLTAVAGNAGGLRWTAVTIDGGDDAKDALDRITIPKEVLDRVGPTALPRSSLVISDEPLNRETNYRTEFVVVLNNQPQGGLAMRKHVDPVRVARGGGWEDIFNPTRWGGGSSWDSQDGRRRGGGQDYYSRQW